MTMPRCRRAPRCRCIAALLRFAEEPRLLGVEWSDGAHPSLYVAGGLRDALAAALLDAAQVRACLLRLACKRVVLTGGRA